MSSTPSPTTASKSSGGGGATTLHRLWKSMSPRRRLEKEPEPELEIEPQRECGEIERVFRYIDADGDGKISPKELQRCVEVVGVQKLTEEEAAAAVESSDSDGDGLLSLTEFERLMGGGDVSEKTAELREAFVMYRDDKDESKCITPKSLKRMLSRLGDSKTIRDCEGMIRVYDLNGDGVLCFDEFAAMMR